uniref:LLA-67 n=1 Tax=Lilium longiflorum TaxID=4690 RepID=B2BA80_LILLO|nr:LLA-67 [Lilium longiflorum]ACJ38888.1 LLA-67 [Lilium longiflorum]
MASAREAGFALLLLMSIMVLTLHNGVVFAMEDEVFSQLNECLGVCSTTAATCSINCSVNEWEVPICILDCAEDNLACMSSCSEPVRSSFDICFGTPAPSPF